MNQLTNCIYNPFQVDSRIFSLPTFFTQGKDEGRCVLFGRCGDSIGGAAITCVVDQPPKKLEPEYVSSLQEYCPELLEKYGTNLCCSPEQVHDLVGNLALPQGLVGRCASCFHNMRQAFCEFTCSPYQYQFMNVTKKDPSQELLEDDYVYSDEEEQAVTEKPVSGEEPVKHPFMVNTADVFIKRSYIEGTYESCKNVLMASTNRPAMDVLCGPHGSHRCSADKWYTYMGSTENGFSPYSIVYRVVDDNNPAPEGIVPISFETSQCSVAPTVSLWTDFWF